MEGVISSDKIMQKLKEIKRTFAENPAEEPAYLRSSEAQSRQNQKLKKYLPESIAKVSAERFDMQSELRQPIGRRRVPERHPITFRKTLEDKLEGLFNEQKHLLRKRYEMNLVQTELRQNTEEYERSMRELESKYNKTSAFNHAEVAEQNGRYHGDQVRSMERKIKQLEERFRESRGGENDRHHLNERVQEPVKKVSKNPDLWRKQMAELKEDLTSLKKANLKLRNRLQKRESSNEMIKLTEQHVEAEKTLMSELDKLRKELADVKAQATSKDICPARVASRQRMSSERESRQRKNQQGMLLELYSQIDQLKYKLGRQSKQRLLLQERNSWLQEQLRIALQRGK